MILSGEGSGVSGTSYTLTCSVILPIGVQATSANIHWKRLNMLLSSSSSIVYGNRGFLATLQLQSLQPTDAGEYICLAGYYIGNITSPLVMKSTTLYVICKSVIAPYISLYSEFKYTSHRATNSLTDNRGCISGSLHSVPSHQHCTDV